MFCGLQEIAAQQALWKSKYLPKK